MEIEYANDWHVDRNDNDHGGKICFSAPLVVKKFIIRIKHTQKASELFAQLQDLGLDVKLKLSINVNVGTYFDCLVGKIRRVFIISLQDSNRKFFDRLRQKQIRIKITFFSMSISSGFQNFAGSFFQRWVSLR